MGRGGRFAGLFVPEGELKTSAYRWMVGARRDPALRLRTQGAKITTADVLVKIINIEAQSGKEKAARAVGPRRFWQGIGLRPWPKLNGFGCRSGRWGGRRLGERAGTGALVRGLVDFDRTLEVGAVLDHDARGGEITIDGAILLDLDPVFGAKVALHGAVDHDFPGNDIGGYLGRGADGKLPLVELDQSFD